MSRSSRRAIDLRAWRVVVAVQRACEGQPAEPALEVVAHEQDPVAGAVQAHAARACGRACGRPGGRRGPAGRRRPRWVGRPAARASSPRTARLLDGRRATSRQVVARRSASAGWMRIVAPSVASSRALPGVVRVAVGDDDAPEITGRSPERFDRPRDAARRPGIAAVDQRQLRLEDEVRLDTREPDLHDVPQGHHAAGGGAARRMDTRTPVRCATVGTLSLAWTPIGRHGPRPAASRQEPDGPGASTPSGPPDCGPCAQVHHSGRSR